MEEAAAWEALPEEEHKSVWDETEHNFWSRFQQQHNDEQAKADKEYQRVCTDARVEIGMLNGRRSELSESQNRLMKELAKVEEELAKVSGEFNDKADRLARLEEEYCESSRTRMETRQRIIGTMKRFFREKRGEDTDVEDSDDIPMTGIIEPRLSTPLSRAVAAPTSAPGSVSASEPARVSEPVAARVPTPLPTQVLISQRTEEPNLNGTGREEPNLEHSSVDGDMDGVEYQEVTEQELPKDALAKVVDADGKLIGSVRRIEPWNSWVKGILDLPIQRPVRIRRGRRFNPNHLESIYERTEAKGVKWLSCMIQAIGAVQSRRCQSCDKNQGAFDECTIVGGELYPKCGNCEWNRQGCHGSSGETFLEPSPVQRAQNILELPAAADSGVRVFREIQPAPETKPHTDPLFVFAPPRGPVRKRGQSLVQSEEANVAGVASHAVGAENVQPSTEPGTPKEATVNGNHTVREHRKPLPVEYRAPSGFTPANSRSRPPSPERRTPSATVEPSPAPSESLPDETLEEITRENLILKHDGTVYTYPECVAGVPLVKIDESHPYWEPSWQNVRTMIVPQLERWKEKHQAAIEAGPKPEKGGSSKYQIGRQVNRGLKILEFLDEGTISPYQLLGKKFIQAGKGGICSYDTLFRLSESISELSKFKLDVSPVEWMRQRLYELMQSEGTNFNLPRTVHDFYHDPKLTALRYKHGFKNIGRPSGMKHGRHSLGSNSSPKVPLKKRKSMHNLASTPRDSTMEQSPLPAQSPLAVQVSVPPESPSSTRLNRHVKYLSPPLGPIHDEFETGNFTDTDSWSGATVGSQDWRLYQVKTRIFTSSTKVTQYWTWLPEEKCFEHQVLKDLKPLEWGLHKEPIDFHVNLDEVSSIVWNIEAMLVHVVMRADSKTIAKKDGKPRGDVLAAFKREKTIRRFLGFCRDKKLEMVKESREELDRRWNSMQSEPLPDVGEEPNADLAE